MGRTLVPDWELVYREKVKDFGKWVIVGWMNEGSMMDGRMDGWIMDGWIK